MRAVLSKYALKGQTSVEFAVIAPVFFVVVFAIFWAGYLFYEQTMVSNQLATLGSELPEDWESLSSEELVEDLILTGSTLDPARLTVVSATVALADPVVDTKQDDAVAQALGKNTSTLTTQTLNVQAQVQYRYSDLGLGWGEGLVASSQVSRSYLIEQSYVFS